VIESEVCIYKLNFLGFWEQNYLFFKLKSNISVIKYDIFENNSDDN
jgi:hypothetical protein